MSTNSSTQQTTPARQTMQSAPERAYVPNAAERFTLVATDGGATVAPPVSRQPTDNAPAADDPFHQLNPAWRYADKVTQHGRAAGRVLTCEQCGRTYTARRRWSRYCSGRCRQAAHRARNSAE